MLNFLRKLFRRPVVIPIPKPRGRGPGGLTKAMKNLRVGESVLFKGASYSATHTRAWRILGAGNYAARKEPTGYRIWRTR